MGDGFMTRRLSYGVLSGVLEISDRFGLVARAMVVMRELRRDFLRAFSIRSFRPLSNSLMKLDSLAYRNAVVKHLTIQGVIEAEVGRNRTVWPARDRRPAEE